MSYAPEPELTTWMRWDPRPPKRPAKRKNAPAFTEERMNRVAAALDPADRDEIHAEAVRYAAEVMADFERKRARR